MSRRRSAPGHPYRQDGDDPQRRAERLEGEVEALRTRITRTYWKYLDAELLALRDAADRSPPPTTTEQWEERGRLLEEYRNQLSRAIAAAPEVEATLTALPNHVSIGDPWPVEGSTVWLAREWANSTPSQAHSPARRLAAYVGRHDLEAQVYQRPFQRLRVPFARIAEVPVALEMSELGETNWSFHLVTPVARATPELLVRPKSWLHGVSEGLGLDRDAKTGDREFDDYFMVRANESTAVLDEPLRKLLLGFAHHAPPKLRIADGSADLAWHYMLTTDLIDRAVEILSRIRYRRLDLALLR